MKIRSLNKDFSVANQIAPADVPAIVRHGFKTIVCNRPDGESDGQPAFSSISAAAEKSGLVTEFFPVCSSAITGENVKDFANLLDRVEAPVLAYCRTGSRCALLWALSRGARGESHDQTMRMAFDAGYDLSGFDRAIKSGSGP